MKRFLLLLTPTLALAQPNQGGGPFPVPPGSATNSASSGGKTYSSINAAADATSPGGLVIVAPGVYREHSWNRPGVNYYFQPGASNFWICTNVTLADAYGFVDDRLSGATTNRIWGYGDFYFSCGTNLNNSCNGNTNAVGAVVTTNANTIATFQCHNAMFDIWPTCNSVPINGQAGNQPAFFYISRGRFIDVNCAEILNPGEALTPNGNASIAMGMYWESGQTYLTCEHIGSFSSYGVWAQGATNQGVQNLWLTANLCEAKLYVSTPTTNDPNFKVWTDFKELHPTNANNSAFSLIGGKCYLKADKIANSAAGGTVIGVTFGELWLNAQKITAGGTAGGKWCDFTGGTNIIQVMQFEEDPTSPSMSEGIAVSAGVTTIQGGRAKTSGVGINYSGGQMYVENLYLSTASSNKPCVLISDTNLTLRNCSMLVTNATTNPMTNCVTATSAKNLAVYYCVANRTNNANITMTTNSMIVDSLLK